MNAAAALRACCVFSAHRKTSYRFAISRGGEVGAGSEAGESVLLFQSLAPLSTSLRWSRCLLVLLMD